MSGTYRIEILSLVLTCAVWASAISPSPTAQYRFDNISTSGPAACSFSDSVPYLMITNLALQMPLEALRHSKTKRGTKTEIVTVENIELHYSGEDIQAKIRACIKDYYENKHLEWVVLGGDETAVPFRYAHARIHVGGDDFISDYYFACLDGDWNADGDEYYGEPEDSADLIPEVAVGRLPFSSGDEVSNYLAKLAAYESGTPLGWQTKALFLGSKMFQSGDGRRACQRLLSLFPMDFVFTELYDDSGGIASRANYFQAMNAGQNIVVKYGNAENESNFILHYEDYLEFLWKDDLDTLSNHGKPSVIYAATCHNHKLDSDCMAEHYMKHPTGGAVAYIGTTYLDYIYCSYPVAPEFFGQLFGSGPKEVGRLLNLAKLTIVPESWPGGCKWVTVVCYLLSGDPQMRIWTDVPEFLMQHHVTSAHVDEDITIVDTVCDAISGDPVEGATVCLMKGDEVYRVAVTNSAGVVSFDVSFPTAGIVTLTAGKHDYVFDEDSISVVIANPPTSFQLFANYPNPFNSSTTISYALPVQSNVKLVIYSVLGREVVTLVDEEQSAGEHAAKWDGRDADGKPVASGVYLYQLRAAKFCESKKMVLLK